VVHRCPYHDEIDVGSVRASWDGVRVELHKLAKHLDSWAVATVTHEELTETVAEYLSEVGGENVGVVTTWHTAGMTVTVTA
jgi:NADPH-dependent 7-cyano-7-deazaguanine reductase QueF